MVTAKIIPCLDCDEKFERKRGQPTSYCPACRAKRNNARHAERRCEREAARRPFVEAAEALRPHLMPSMYQHAIEVAHELAENGPRVKLPPDRMPDGTHSDRGPDDGTSTNWTDLAEHLDQQQARALADEWFTDNPHWREGLYE